MHTLPRNSGGHTLFLFFASFRRAKSALCHLLCEATCSLKTDKQLGNVTSGVEYSKFVTAQQLGDRIMHNIQFFLRIMHILRLKYNRWIEKTYSLTHFLCWRSNFKNSCFLFHQVSKRPKTIKPLGLRPRGFKCFSRLETWWNTHTRFWNITWKIMYLNWRAKIWTMIYVFISFYIFISFSAFQVYDIPNINLQNKSVQRHFQRKVVPKSWSSKLR